jgi:hypothetical protein
MLTTRLHNPHQANATANKQNLNKITQLLFMATGWEATGWEATGSGAMAAGAFFFSIAGRGALVRRLGFFGEVDGT